MRENGHGRNIRCYLAKLALACDQLAPNPAKMLKFKNWFGHFYTTLKSIDMSRVSS